MTHRVKGERKAEYAKELDKWRWEAWNPKDPDSAWVVNKRNQIFHRNGMKGNWNHVPGGLMQISNGPIGTFGVNRYHDIYYRRGTHEDYKSAGTGWSQLPGKLKYVSAGKNAVWGVNKDDMIYVLRPAFKGGDIDIRRGWQQIPGRLSQISASKDSDVVWGVNKNGRILYRDFKRYKNGGSMREWKLIPGALKQVEIGPGGVYGVNFNNEVFYRAGTYEKPGSSGTHWQILNGGLSHISVGRNGIWGSNSKQETYWAPSGKRTRAGKPYNRWRKISGGGMQISAY